MVVVGAKSLVLPMSPKDGRRLFQYIIRGFPLCHNIKKGFLAASFLVQLNPDFGYSGFLRHIRGEKRVPACLNFMSLQFHFTT